MDLLRVEDGYALALTAALGDDLLAGLEPGGARHWRSEIGGATPADAPALPAGCRALAEVVSAPPALARRLAQVGIAPAADAEARQGALAQGQRLVSPDGGLWRWDGLVRRPDTQDAATVRLRQQERRRELEDLLQAARAQLAALESAADRAAAAAAGAQMHRQQAAAEREAARSAYEEVRETLVRTRAEAAALTAELGALAKEQDALALETSELRELQTPLQEALHEATTSPRPSPPPRHGRQRWHRTGRPKPRWRGKGRAGGGARGGRERSEALAEPRRCCARGASWSAPGSRPGWRS